MVSITNTSTLFSLFKMSILLIGRFSHSIWLNVDKESLLFNDINQRARCNGCKVLSAEWAFVEKSVIFLIILIWCSCSWFHWYGQFVHNKSGRKTKRQLNWLRINSRLIMKEQPWGQIQKRRWNTMYKFNTLYQLHVSMLFFWFMWCCLSLAIPV